VKIACLFVIPFKKIFLVILKLTQNECSCHYIAFIVNSWQFKIMTTGSQPGGARWPEFYYVQMMEPMSLAATLVALSFFGVFALRFIWCHLVSEVIFTANCTFDISREL